MSNAAEGGVAMSRVRLLMSAMARDGAIYQQFEPQLAPSHIHSPALSYFYMVLKEVKQEAKLQGEAEVSIPEIRARLRENLELMPNLLDWDEKEELKRFLKKCLVTSYCEDLFGDRKTLNRLLYKTVKDLLSDSLREESIRGLAGASNVEVSKILKQYSTRADEIEATVGENEVLLTFDPEWDRQPVYKFVSTGIPFMDKLLGGGMNWREVTGFMGPFGSCKTATAVNLCVNGAWASYSEYLQQLHLPENERRCGISVIISYEATRGELQYRIIQCAAKVEFDSVVQMGEGGVESLRGEHEDPRDYEKSFFSQQLEDGTFVPEKDRVKQAIPWLNRHTLVLDFSASGNGGVPEMVASIQKQLAARGPNHYIHSVFIDYAGLMVQRYLRTREKEKSGRFIEEHSYLTACVGEVKTGLAMNFDTPVILFHQLSGAANKKTKTIRLADKTEAKGSTTFSEHLANSLIVSHLDENQVGLMGNGKTRRSGAAPPVAFRLYGAMCLLQEANDYTVDMTGALKRKKGDEPAIGEVQSSLVASEDDYPLSTEVGIDWDPDDDWDSFGDDSNANLPSLGSSMQLPGDFN
jgi:hypothetical protein